MSAFIVEDETINKIVAFLASDSRMKWYLHGLRLDTDEQMEEFGWKLFKLNIDGVNARYGAGEAESFRDGPLTYKFQYLLPESPIKALKSLQCLIYQCSEGNVVKQPLYKFLSDIERGLMSDIISRIPEYDQAKWG